MDKKKSGCPKKLIPPDKQFLKVSALRNRKKVRAELVQGLRRATGTIEHPYTVQLSLLRSGLKGCVKKLYNAKAIKKKIKILKIYIEWQKKSLGQGIVYRLVKISTIWDE